MRTQGRETADDSVGEGARGRDVVAGGQKCDSWRLCLFVLLSFALSNPQAASRRVGKAPALGGLGGRANPLEGRGARARLGCPEGAPSGGVALS
jgi:hypothetical protein